MYFALAPKKIVTQLKEEQSCIQYTDIKQLALEIGDMFHELEFLVDIPQEIYIDAMQFQVLTGWSSNAISIHLGLLSSDALRLSALSRYFLINVLQLGGRLVDAIQLVVLMDSIEMRGIIKPKREGVVNDFLEALHLIDRLQIHEFPYGFKYLFAKACQHMCNINFDIYQGESLISRPDIL